MKEGFYLWCEDMLEMVKKVGARLSLFFSKTCKDFVSVWKVWPNVLIWCGVVVLIALFV